VQAAEAAERLAEQAPFLDVQVLPEQFRVLHDRIRSEKSKPLGVRLRARSWLSVRRGAPGAALVQHHHTMLLERRLQPPRGRRRALERPRRLVDLASAGSIVLPDGEVVSPSRMRSIGSALGTDDGWTTVWSLLEQDPASNAFRYDLAAAMPFDGRNPLYFVFHESSYASGHATRWSAERMEPADFREDTSLFTGEHVRSEWTETVPAFRPWRDVTLKLAEHEWPRIYDADALRASGARGAAAVYVNDVYVPLEFSLQTAALMPGVSPYVTSEHEHNGLRAGDVLEHLVDLAHGRRVR
jgi:hypothetical protein